HVAPRPDRAHAALPQQALDFILARDDCAGQIGKRGLGHSKRSTPPRLRAWETAEHSLCSDAHAMRLRVVTWNIHKGIGGVDRRYSLERTISVLASLQPD